MKRFIEIRSGEGGVDSQLLVQDLAKAYTKYISRLG